MKLLAGLLLLNSTAYGFSTSAYLSSGLGYNLTEKQATAVIGLGSKINLFNLSWWQYTGIAPEARTEWFSHTQGLDFKFSDFTTTFQYKISNDIKFDKPFDKEVGFRLKVVIW